MSRRNRVLLRLGLAGFALAVLVGLGALLALRSAWLAEQVRRRIVREVEEATGGRVEIGKFAFDWRALRAEVSDFVLHGTEPAGEDPLFSAEAIRVDLKVVSFFRRQVDLRAVEVRRPGVTILVDERGRTNLPVPKRARRRHPLATIVDLAIGRFDLAGGSFRYADSRVPLDVRGESLRAALRYERAGGLYRGEATARQITRAASRSLAPPLDTGIEMSVEKGRIAFPRIRLASKHSRAELSGAIEMAPSARAVFELTAALSIAEFGPHLRLPVDPVGRVEFSGTLGLGGGSPYSLRGQVTARGMAARWAGVGVRGVDATAALRLSPEELLFEQLHVSALNGAFRGEARLEKFRRLELEGDVSGLAIHELAALRTDTRLPWSAEVRGPLRLEAQIAGPAPAGMSVSTQLTLAPRTGKIPLAGFLDLTWDQRGREVHFGLSHLETAHTRVHFSGSLGDGLRVGLFSRDLNDLLPALEVAGGDPRTVPVRLNNGVARFDGHLHGPFDSPRLSGDLSCGPLSLYGHRLDQLTAELVASEGNLEVRSLAARRDSWLLQGRARMGLVGWKAGDASALQGTATLRGGRLREALTEAGVGTLPVDGLLSAGFDLTGTLSSPRAVARVRVEKPVAYEEEFDRFDAELRYSPGEIGLSSGRLAGGSGVALLSGAYRYTPGKWKDGQVRFESTGSAWSLGGRKLIREFRKGLDGQLTWKATGAVEVIQARPRLAALNGEAAVAGIVLDRTPLGSLGAGAATRGRLLVIDMNGSLRDSRVAGRGEWSLAGDSLGLGELHVSHLTTAALQDIGLLGGPGVELPFRGLVNAEVGFSGPVLQPRRWTAAAKITTLEVAPGAPLPRAGEAAPRDLTVRNREPFLVMIDSRGVHVESARFFSRDLDLEGMGTVSFGARNPWNLQLKGTMDLGVLSALRPDLLSVGRSTLEVAIRGSLVQPQIVGRMELADASFHLRGVPNGIEKANGAILFDRTRATIEKLTSQTGGGDLVLSGFLGFGGEELVYRLQGRATRVRVRYPEGISTSLDADLSLTGSSTRSLLAGAVTVSRLGVTTRTDLGGLLAESLRSGPSLAVTNEFLRGMQFDIRLQTSPDIELETALTQDFEPEADLRVRGGPARPVLLGRVAINRGEIRFFGNQYTITRGEVSFFNPVRVEPVLDLDLETRVRGITVTINFSGPVNKLNVSYRSDPPLQSTEIIALLTVGRTPAGTAGTTYGTTQGTQNLFQAGGNSLLGQAVSAPLTGRLQRLFGISRLKIDPELTGVANTPQARLTIEQQLSRDITITYITHLNRAQQQIVQVQWDFSKDFSALAVRDENGVFGIDFQYRRRFK